MSDEVRQTKKYYDQNAQRWSDVKTNSFFHEKEFVRLVKHLPKKGGSVIDIGCAGGIHVPLFLGIGRHLKYHGLDISQSFLKIAKRRYPQLTFTKGNIADKKTLPSNKRFDGFLAIAVLMHLPFQKWDTAFSGIEHICKPRAHGYVVLPIKTPGGKQAPSDTRHFEILTEDEQKAYLASRNWKIRASGTKDGFHKENVWRWYIVELPEKKRA